MKSSWTRAILLVLAASAGCTWTASTLQETIIPKAATEAPAVARFVGAFPREASAAGASATLPTLRELEAMLKRAHERDGGVGRNLISNGRPTGGSKYPFLVSMWLGTSNDVRFELASCDAPPDRCLCSRLNLVNMSFLLAFVSKS